MFCFLQFEKERYGGRLPPNGITSPTAVVSAITAEAADFHWQLASTSCPSVGDEASQAQPSTSYKALQGE